jgi:serine/threonine protein kinase
MATAASSPTDIVAALDGGADDYVTKPFNFPVLIARLEARMRMKPAPAPKTEPRPPAPTLVGRFKALLSKPAAQPALALRAGDLLGDRYSVEGPLGSGAFGTVYRARHVDLDQSVAVKVLTRTGPHGTIEALRDEAQRACRVRHPNAVRVLDFGLLPPRSAFLVMELLEGPTLEVALKRAGQMTEQAATTIIRDVLGALAAMHKLALVHRDVKPANVLLHRERDLEIAKLLDFGTARAEDDRDDESEGMLGSLAYMSPERLRGDDYDGKADVYSCGITLYKLLTGALPMDVDLKDLDAIARWHVDVPAPPPSAMRDELSAEIDDLVLKLLVKDPAARPDAEGAQRLISALS